MDEDNKLTKAQERELERAFADWTPETLRSTLQVSDAFSLPRKAELCTANDIRAWFWEQSPIAIATGAIQVRHSRSKETTQLMGMLMDVPFKCRSCGNEEPKDILHTKHYWIVCCNGRTGCQGKMWWIHRGNLPAETVAQFDTFLVLANPYFVRQVDRDMVSIEKEHMRAAGYKLVEEHHGGVMANLVYIKKGAENQCPRPKIVLE